MKRTSIAALLALAMMSLLAPPAGSGGQKPPPASSTGDEFKGKVILVFSKGQLGPILEKARIRELGQRVFLVGKAPDDGSRWANSVLWLAMEDVSMIAAFDNLDDARRAARSK